MIQAPAVPSDGQRPRQRQRRWEQAHQSHKVAYRGVEPQIARQVKLLAEARQVTTGEVARVVIEYALRAYAQGDLALQPQSKPGHLRRTLEPSAGRWSARPAQRKPASAPWRVVTTWRGFPPTLKQELATLASAEGLHVPSGELITALLRYGLKAHQAGLCRLPGGPLAKAGRT